jgi:tetratricopeptide (TPR) repeat protein
MKIEKYIMMKLEHINIFSLLLAIIILFAIFHSVAIGSEAYSFAVYFFENGTGDDNWRWLERGLPDMLSHTFSQFDEIKYVPLEEMERLTNIDDFKGLAKRKDHSLFRSLNNLLQVNLIFTGYFSIDKQKQLQFNLVMYQSQGDEIFEFREIPVVPENLLNLKENLARIILQEAGVFINDELATNLKKNISPSLNALKNYYYALEYKNQAEKEYQGIDFPSKPLWSKAIEYGEKAVTEDPYFAEAYYLLSQIYEKTKWTIREVTSLEKFIETAKNNSNIKISYQKLSEALYKLAYSKYSREEVASAIEHLEDAIFYEPNNIQARTYLMRIYYDTGQISKALQQAEEVRKIEASNREIEWFYRQYQQAEIYGKEAYEIYVAGYNAYSNKNWFEAIRLLKQAVSLNKDFKEAHYYLALSYYQTGELDAAIRHFEEAIRLDPFDNNIRVHLNRAMEEKEFGREAVWLFNEGYELYISGGYEKALLKFKESSQKNPTFDKNRIYLMRTYYHLNLMDEYLSEREKIGIQGFADEDWGKEYYQLAYDFYSLGDYEIALEKLQEVLEVNPDYLEARFLIAETFYQLGKYKEANQHYQYIINNFMDSKYYENALLGSGWCSYLLGDFAQSENVLEILVNNFPKSPLYQEGIYKLGRVYFKEKKYAQTISLYEDLVASGSLEFDKYELNYILGQSYFWEGNYDKAKIIFSDIVTNKPDFEFINETQYYHSYILFEEGSYEEAKLILEELVKKENSSIRDEALYLLARVLLEQKEYDRVISINRSLVDTGLKDNTMLERVLFDLGLAYARKGDNKGAIPYFKKVIDDFPQGELAKIATIELAYSYYYLGQYRDVLMVLEDIDNKEAMELKIDAASKINDDEKLFSLYQELAEKYPDETTGVEGYFALAKSYYEKGEFEKAIHTFQIIEDMTITEEIRKEINYWQGLSFFRLGNYPKAEEYFQLIDYFSGDEIAIRALYMLGETYYQEGDYIKAIRYYQDFLNYYGAHSLAAHVQYSISWSYLNEGDFTRAIESFNMLIEKYPESQFVEESNFLLSKIPFLLNNYGESRIKLQDFIKFYPGSQYIEEALYIIAQIDLAEEEWIDSIINFEKLIERYPDSRYLPGSLYGLCLSYFKKGEYNKALEVGERYLNNFSSGTFMCDILYITAICQEELGEIKKAKEKYNMIIQNCSDTSYIDSAREHLQLLLESTN